MPLRPESESRMKSLLLGMTQEERIAFMVRYAHAHRRKPVSKWTKRLPKNAAWWIELAQRVKDRR